MSTQTLVPVTTEHMYHCPECDCDFGGTPIHGYFFDIENIGMHDENCDLFIEGDTKVIKGVERWTCHGVRDNGDGRHCTMDEETAKSAVVVCHGWKCEGCGFQAYWDNDNCDDHELGRDSDAECKSYVARNCSCSDKPRNGGAPEPVVEAPDEGLHKYSNDRYTVGATCTVNVDRPLAAGLATGAVVTIEKLLSSSESSDSGLHVRDVAGNLWGIHRCHVDVTPGAVDPYQKDVVCRVLVQAANGASVNVGDLMRIVEPHVPYMKVYDIQRDRTWNMSRDFLAPVEEVDTELLDKFVAKKGEKKVTVIDW